jgi:hypothetical protein
MFEINVGYINISLITMGPTTDWCPPSQLRPTAPLTWSMSSMSVSTHIVQSVFDHFFKVFHNILVLGQVPVLFELLVPRTHHNMALGVPGAHHIPRFRTSWTCPQVSCMLLITLKVNFECGSHATINFEAQASVMLRLDKYGTLNESFSISSYFSFL